MLPVGPRSLEGIRLFLMSKIFRVMRDIPLFTTIAIYKHFSPVSYILIKYLYKMNKQTVDLVTIDPLNA